MNCLKHLRQLDILVYMLTECNSTSHILFDILHILMSSSARLKFLKRVLILIVLLEYARHYEEDSKITLQEERLRTGT